MEGTPPVMTPELDAMRREIRAFNIALRNRYPAGSAISTMAPDGGYTEWLTDLRAAFHEAWKTDEAAAIRLVETHQGAY